MTCVLAISNEQNIRQDVKMLSYRLRCQYCNIILYRTAHSGIDCINCGNMISGKINYLFGFQPARLRYYNNSIL